MSIVFVLAGVVIKELCRRKDIYVLFFLTAGLTLVLGSANFFQEQRLVRYVKDVCLLLIWISGFIIAIGTAARQIPTELENRTIFPLLAKPVTRGQFIAGKFLGAWLACGLTLLVFYLLFAVVVGAREGRLAPVQLAQVFCLQWMMLGMVVGMALFGSVLFSAPSANATICAAVIMAILVLGGHLHRLALLQPAPIGLVLSGIYFLIPHLEWFYAARERLVFEQAPLAWSDCALAMAYATVYAGLLGCAAWLVFRRKRLSAG